MNETRDPSQTSSGARGVAATVPTASGSDPVVRALEDYLAALQSGQRPDHDTFLQQHPGVPRRVVECLEGLDFVHATTLQMDGAGSFAAPHECLQSRLLGDFLILREIGRGGMGVVYEAEQRSLNRRVALKVLPLAAALDPHRMQRFLCEARAVASLQHPNIIPIFANGQDHGIHFYAMQFIEGQSLDAVIREYQRSIGRFVQTKGKLSGEPTQQFREECGGPAAEPATPPQAPGGEQARDHSLGIPASVLAGPEVGNADYCRNVARLGVQVAEALHHAHERGVIHRDVKPGNVLLDGLGKPWVTDFGLAQFQPELGLTQTGAMLGTARYVSPEQAMPHRLPVDARTDVYSLGATLYELLTLEPAVPGDDRQDVLQRVATHEPVPPRRLNRAIPADLETIVLKALAKDPVDRYDTARAMASDLQRFLDNRSILGKRQPAHRQFARWIRHCRRPVIVGLAGIGLAAIALAMVLWMDDRRRGDRAALDWYQSHLREARALREAKGVGYRPAVLGHLAEASRVDSPSRDLRELRQEATATLADPAGIAPVTMRDWPAPIRALALHPTRPLLAVGLDDGTICIRESRLGTERERLRGHRATVQALAFDDGGETLVSVGSDRAVVLWRNSQEKWDTPRQIATLPLLEDAGQPAPGVCLARAGNVVALCRRGTSQLTLLDLANGLITQQLALPAASAVTCLDVSRNGRLLVAACRSSKSENELLLWDLTQPQASPRRLGVTEETSSLAFSPDGKVIGHAGAKGGFSLIDLPGFLHAEHVAVAQERFGSLHFADGQRLLAVNADVNMALLSHVVSAIEAKRVLRPFAELRIHDPLVGEPAPTLVRQSADGCRIATASDQVVSVWELGHETVWLPLAGHSMGLTAIAMSPDAALLATAGEDQLIRIWNPRDGKLIHVLEDAMAVVQGLAFLDGGSLLLAAAKDGGVRAWSVTDWRPRGVQPQRLGDGLVEMKASPDGKLLAGSCTAGVFAWRVERGEDGGLTLAQTGEWRSQQGGGPLALCPSGGLLASGRPGEIAVWDLDGTALCTIGVGKDRFVPRPHLMKGGTAVLFINPQGMTEVWRLDGRERIALLGQSNTFSPTGEAQALSHDGRWFIANSRSQALELWDLQGQERILSFPGRTAQPRFMIFSADDSLLVVGGSFDGSLAVWNLEALRRQLDAIGLGW